MRSPAPRTSGGRLDVRADAEMLVAAAEALASLDDPSATAGLLVFLHDHAAGPPSRQLDRVLTAVLDALARVGDDLAIPVLEHWRGRPAPVGPAADRALAAVRERAARTLPR